MQKKVQNVCICGIMQQHYRESANEKVILTEKCLQFQAIKIRYRCWVLA